MKYLAYIKPSEEFLNKAGDYVQNLGDDVSKNLLDTGHCTVFYGQLANVIKGKKTAPKIIKGFKNIIPSPARDTRIEKLELFDKSSLVARLEDSAGYIRRIHFSLINTFREFLDRDILDNLELIPQQYRENRDRVRVYQTWGSEYSGDLYAPHITLCRLKQVKEGILTNPFEGIEWVTDEVYLAKRVEGKWEDIALVKLH